MCLIRPKVLYLYHISTATSQFFLSPVFFFSPPPHHAEEDEGEGLNDLNGLEQLERARRGYRVDPLPIVLYVPNIGMRGCAPRVLHS